MESGEKKSGSNLMNLILFRLQEEDRGMGLYQNFLVIQTWHTIYSVLWPKRIYTFTFLPYHGQGSIRGHTIIFSRRLGKAPQITMSAMGGTNMMLSST